jgi:membrane-bound metal-dependent hydrolase YbcI (DUF457 family)
MCTPIGHSLAGIVLWTAIVLPARHSLGYLWRWARRQWEGVLLAVLMANLCDLDYLPGLLSGDLNRWHHMYSHSIGWVVLAGVGTCLIWKGLQPATEDRYLALVFAALGSHLLLDWMTEDGCAPFGIMAGWPFSLGRTLSPWPVFPKVEKDQLSDLWQWSNLFPVGVEVLFFGVLFGLALVWKMRRQARHPAKS